MKSKVYIDQMSDWNSEDILKYDKEIGKIAKDKYKLDTYDTTFEILSAEQMLDRYTTSGMPIMYPHWSFGKDRVMQEKQYREGKSSLAYELVINSNPSKCYLMDSNTAAMQALVIAHAAYGHNSFFKNNYLFKEYTRADKIIPYLDYANRYISKCIDDNYSTSILIDLCHSLADYSVDTSAVNKVWSENYYKDTINKRLEHRENSVVETDIIKLDLRQSNPSYESRESFSKETSSNLLRILRDYGTFNNPEEKEVVNILMNINRYFYPQKQTKVMNEGWASFIHYNIIGDLYDKKLMSEGALLECLHAHTNVCHPGNPGTLNPYRLGSAIFNDIRRICENPTEEDIKWFPELIGTEWLDSVTYAMMNFNDSSFILQYLSPKVIRDLRLALINIKDPDPISGDVYCAFDEVHDEDGYKEIRSLLANQYKYKSNMPDLHAYEYLLSEQYPLLRIGVGGTEVLTKDTLSILNKLAKYLIVDLDIVYYDR